MFDKKITSLINGIISGFNLALYISMRSVLGFIGHKIYFPPITYILAVVFLFVFICSIWEILYNHDKKILIGLFIFSSIAFVAIITYFSIMVENYKMFFMELSKILFLYAVIAVIVYIIFYFPKSKIYTKSVSVILCIIMITAVFIGFTDLKNLQINYFTNGAAVYVYEDTYQIVWTTHSKGIGWVEINGNKYYDEYAGGIATTRKVHKVTVPQADLDNSRAYTINSRAMINEEAYSAWQGRIIKKQYNFRPIDESDGIQYYTIADTHNNNKKAVAAGSYFGKKTDFLILAGDIVSYLDSDADLERILFLAHKMTNGEIPVIFARGNHELKGKKAEDLHKYVSCGAEGEFYYTFRLGKIWGIVLDMGENHNDDWHEHYGTANYNSYREKQVDWLDDILSEKEYNDENIIHKIAISHILTSFVSETNFFMYDVFTDINARLNEIKLDALICGHRHEFYVLEKNIPAGEKLFYQPEYSGKQEINPKFDLLSTGATYNTVVCARRSVYQTQKEKVLGKTYTGTAFEYEIDGDGDNLYVVKFTNNHKKAVATINPFTGKNNGNAIYLK